MEVFLANVPDNLTDKSLAKELTPWTNALGIVDWACMKPRRKNIGWMLFLNQADGFKFLARHEKRSPAVQPGVQFPIQAGVRPPRDIARLNILGMVVFVTRSNRRIGPEALSNLAYERDERDRRLARGAPPRPFRCRLWSIACGNNVYSTPSKPEDSPVLTFAQHLVLERPAHARLDQRCLSIDVNNGQNRIDIPYEIVQDIIADRKGPTLTLVLAEPPRFYASRPLMPGNRTAVWECVASVSSWANHAKYAGRCLVYQLRVLPEYAGVIPFLRDGKRTFITMQHIDFNPRPLPYMHEYSTCLSSFEGAINQAGYEKSVPWPLLFQVQALVWNNYLHPAGASQFLAALEKLFADPKWQRGALPLTTDSMKRMMHDMPYPCPGADPSYFDPKVLLAAAVDDETGLRRDDPGRYGVYAHDPPGHQAWVFKATVTPTRILLQGPDAESKNRVLRMHSDHGDHFLRVSFCDEDGQDLHFTPKVSNEVVYARYRKVLSDGIQIVGRTFAFLGFSHSSLRSHSTWFLAPFVDNNHQLQDYNNILSSLGDFSEIRIAAKCAARIGQAFSETPSSVDLINANIVSRSIPDVKSADGTRVFSDGVGTISRDALEEVWDALPTHGAAPTCLQIRWGGVKGMLSLDSRLRGKVICVRNESMMKFPSRDRRELGICDSATRLLRMFLNRQLIKILEDMGTREAWFTDLQNDALKMLRAVTHTAANTSTFLQYQSIGSALGFPAFIGQLDKMGIDYRRDTFLRSVVEHVVLRELRLLKHKARIPVTKGVTLFGVMDETGFLDEGEVYIAFDKIHYRSGARLDASLVDGPVIVTRCPALHPGDVQIPMMRTPPAGHPLRNLNNCIAFSQRGERDLPSQLSGGDLDGDLYNIIWDPRARPQLVYAPANYPRTRAPELDRAVRRDDIADFFILFMQTDILGLIANRHQILADISPKGTCDIDCVKLAEMHSTAVDFSKTGLPVMPNEMPRAPRTRPDFLAPAPPVKLYDLGQIEFLDEIAMDEEDEEEGFMGSARHRYHRSEKILGRLYRGIDEKKIWDEDIRRHVSADGPTVWEQLLGRIGAELEVYGIDVEDKSLVKEAWKIRNLYEDSIYDAQWHFSDKPRACLTEVEVFCCSVLNNRGSQTRKQRDLSMSLKDETDRVMTWIVGLIRRRRGAGGGFGGSGDVGSVTGASELREREEIVRLCWACTKVGCEPHPDAKPGECCSFRAVAGACLVAEMSVVRSRAKAIMAGGGFPGVTTGRQDAQETVEQAWREKMAATTTTTTTTAKRNERKLGSGLAGVAGSGLSEMMEKLRAG